MSYYGYQYKQQCYIPGGMKSPAALLAPQCCVPGGMKCPSALLAPQCCPLPVVPCGSCSPCAPAGAKACTVRKTLPGSPRCAGPCVETHVVEGHHHHSSSSSSSCSTRCPAPCSLPQALGQGRELLAVPSCGQAAGRRCPQVCAPAPGCQQGSCPYSYQWANSYQYNCGQQQ